MSEQRDSDPRDDPRSVDELINAALSETDENLAWNAIGALHGRGTREVVIQAAALCRSACEQERRLAADILGQVGVPKRTFPRECAGLLLDMLNRPQPPAVLRAVFVALGHLHAPEAIAVADRFRRHPDSDVRHAVVLALTGHDHPMAVRWLIELTRDPEALVRDWATFALGSLTDLDTAELREALAARLADPDDTTRGEALVGLARRRDRRVLPALEKELSAGHTGSLVIEAAEEIGAPELYSRLIALREWPDSGSDPLERAMVACRPRPDIS